MMKKMKNNNINKTGLIIGAFCLIMVSCKAPSLTPTEKIELPKWEYGTLL
jgi:outer membrane protein, multidrug efflux system